MHASAQPTNHKALLDAITAGDPDAVERLLQEPSVDLTANNNEILRLAVKRAAMAIAAEYPDDHLKILDLLLSHCDDTLRQYVETDRQKYQHFQQALENNDIQNIEMLLPKVWCDDIGYLYKYAIIHHAAEYCTPAIVRSLLQHASSQPATFHIDSSIFNDLLKRNDPDILTLFMQYPYLSWSSDELGQNDDMLTQLDDMIKAINTPVMQVSDIQAGILIAIKRNDIQTIRTLLQGGSIHPGNLNGLIYLAIRLGHVDAVRELFPRCPPKQSRFFLKSATIRGHLEIVQALLALDQCPEEDFFENWLRQILRDATEHNQTTIIDWVFTQHAELINEFVYANNIFAAIIGQATLDTIKCLLDKPRDWMKPDRLHDIFDYLLKRNDADILALFMNHQHTRRFLKFDALQEMMVERLKDRIDSVNESSISHCSYFYYLAKRNQLSDTPIPNELIERIRSQACPYIPTIWTSARYGDAKIVEEFLQGSNPPDARAICFAFREAAAHGHIEILNQLLLDNARSPKGLSPLFALLFHYILIPAITHQQIAVVNWLFATHSETMSNTESIPDKDYVTAIELAIKHLLPAIVERLLANRKHWGVPDILRNVLLEAAQRGDTPIAKLILSHVRSRDLTGSHIISAVTKRSAFLAAVEGGHIETLQLLYAHKCDMDDIYDYSCLRNNEPLCKNITEIIHNTLLKNEETASILSKKQIAVIRLFDAFCKNFLAEDHASYMILLDVYLCLIPASPHHPEFDQNLIFISLQNRLHNFRKCMGEPDDPGRIHLTQHIAALAASKETSIDTLCSMLPNIVMILSALIAITGMLIALLGLLTMWSVPIGVSIAASGVGLFAGYNYCRENEGETLYREIKPNGSITAS